MYQIRQQLILSLLIYLIAIMIAINLIIMYVLIKNSPLIVEGSDQPSSHLPHPIDNPRHEKFREDAKSLRFRVQNSGEIKLIGPATLTDGSCEMYKIFKKIEGGFNLKYARRKLSITRRNNQSIFIAKKVATLRNRLGSLIRTLQSGKVSSITEDVKLGTQLKLRLGLEGNFQALFKPNWFPNSGDQTETLVEDGEIVYKGKDRSSGEIASYYTSLVLEYFEPGVPIATGRRLHLRNEILPLLKKDDLFTKTFYFSKESKSFCFYGNCYFCSQEESVCGDERGSLEGVIILMRNDRNWKQYTNPWRRVYPNSNSLEESPYAEWQKKSICSKFISQNPSPSSSKNSTKAVMNDALLLDIVSTSIFDFLIGNGDRHHLEILNGSPEAEERILLFDNGKSFGNPHEDYIDILSPLVTCCRLRENLRIKLEEFSEGGYFKEFFTKLVNSFERGPLLSQSHLDAIERRILIVLTAFETCQNSH